MGRRLYHASVRILFLGNSNEWLSLPPGVPRRHEIIERDLAATYGPVEVVTKPAWPTADFAGVLGRWVRELDPDIVYLNVAEYWCLFESVPLRIERMLGKFGKPLARVGKASAGTPWVAHNPAFRRLREASQAVLPGGIYFTPRQVVERVMECVHVCLRDEGLVIIVDGQRGRRPHAATKRGRARVEARRQYVHQRLQAECAKLHVTYGGDDIPQWRTHPEGLDGHRDGLHQGARGQVWMADEAVALIREALSAAGWAWANAESSSAAPGAP